MNLFSFKSFFASLLFAPCLLNVPAQDNIAASSSPAIAAQMQVYIDKHQVAGAVALSADKDKILSVTTVGYQDLATQKPITPNSMFWLASMTKPFTASALMMLVDEGKVNIDDPISKYLPEFNQPEFLAPPKGQWKPVPATHPITVREILTHTSGLGFRSKAESKGLDVLSLADATKSYATSWLGFEPGTAYGYSNEGFNVAARLIEVVSGMPYEKFMDERLFQPLGMTDTTFWPNQEQLGRLVKTYAQVTANGVTTLVEKPWTGLLTYPLDNRQTRFPMGGGGLFSTAVDVSKFARMILNNGTLDGKQYLAPATVAEMTQDQTGIHKNYGFGWAIDPDHIEHRGLSNTSLSIFPKEGIVAVFLANQNGPFPWAMHIDFEKTAIKEAQGSQPPTP